MILIGMFDSPFVRRVAVSMKLLAIPFEHRNWSVGKDFDRIREFNPLGRVPTLVLDDGESLIESATILDYLDDFVGPARSLLPPAGRDRREAARPATPGERGAVLELLLGAPAPRPTGIALRCPCCAQALGGHSWLPVRRMRRTRVRGVQLGLRPS